MKKRNIKNYDVPCEGYDDIGYRANIKRDTYPREKRITQEKENNNPKYSDVEYEHSCPHLSRGRSTNKRGLYRRINKIFKSKSMNVLISNFEQEIAASNNNNEVSKDSHWNNVFRKLRNSRRNMFSSNSRRKNIHTNDVLSDHHSDNDSMSEEESSVKEHRRTSSELFLAGCKDIMHTFSNTIRSDDMDDDEQNIERMIKSENSDFYVLFKNDNRFWVEDDGWITLPSERRKDTCHDCNQTIYDKLLTTSYRNLPLVLHR